MAVDDPPLTVFVDETALLSRNGVDVHDDVTFLGSTKDVFGLWDGWVCDKNARK